MIKPALCPNNRGRYTCWYPGAARGEAEPRRRDAKSLAEVTEARRFALREPERGEGTGPSGRARYGEPGGRSEVPEQVKATCSASLALPGGRVGRLPIIAPTHQK
jgi:hypothetical protein